MSNKYYTGKLDRRITIQRATYANNSFNESIATWNSLATVWANRQDASASEAMRALEVSARLTCRFTIRKNSQVADVNPKDRILFEGGVYDIVAVREPKGTRNFLIEIDAVTRSDK